MSTGGVNVCLGTLHLIRRSPSQNVLYRPEQVKFSPRLQVGLIPLMTKVHHRDPARFHCVVTLCKAPNPLNQHPAHTHTETEWQRFLRYHTMKCEENYRYIRSWWRTRCQTPQTAATAGGHSLAALRPPSNRPVTDLRTELQILH